MPPDATAFSSTPPDDGEEPLECGGAAGEAGAGLGGVYGGVWAEAVEGGAGGQAGEEVTVRDAKRGGRSRMVMRTFRCFFEDKWGLGVSDLASLQVGGG